MDKTSHGLNSFYKIPLFYFGIFFLLLLAAGIYVIFDSYEIIGYSLSYNDLRNENIPEGPSFPSSSELIRHLDFLPGSLLKVVVVISAGTLFLTIFFISARLTPNRIDPDDFNLRNPLKLKSVKVTVVAFVMVTMLIFLLYEPPPLSTGPLVILNSAHKPIIKLDVHGPSEINANMSFPVWATLELEPSENLLETDQFLATTRLQAGGFTIPSDLQNWQEPKKTITLRDKPFWVWNITPSLDRFGEQSVIVEGQIYDSNNKKIDEAIPYRILMNVRTPLGLPGWLGYLITFISGIFSIAIFTWLWEIIKERHLKKGT